jgi:hypothetical protein
MSITRVEELQLKTASISSSIVSRGLDRSNISCSSSLLDSFQIQLVEMLCG